MEDRPDDAAPPPESGRARRAPPTIDLEASQVTEKVTEKPERGSAPSGGEAAAEGVPSSRPSLISPFLVSAVTAAVTASIVIAGAWAIGGPRDAAPPVAKAVIDSPAIEALSSRMADLESRAAKPSMPVPDPAQSAKLDALEKSMLSLRNEAASARARSDRLASDLDAVKSVPGASATPANAPDLAAIESRLDQIERAARAETDKIAQVATKPADDTALRRLVVASMLDLSVRQGEPFGETLAAARVLASDPQTLKPLEGFASSGVPSPAALCRELLTLVPKLSPPAPQASTTGSGILDRLQAGASKLVRIERTDASGNDRGAIVARITAAAIRNDVVDARRELNSLETADRAAAQGWLDKAGERDAALAAAHRFTTEAMAALAKPVR